MGGIGSGRPQKPPEAKSNRVQKGITLSPEEMILLQDQAMKVGPKGVSHGIYLGILLKKDTNLMSIELGNEISNWKSQLENNIETLKGQINTNEVLLKEVNKMLKRLGR